MATEDQDFSFPVVTETHQPPAIDSPPLWHLSPASSPNHHHYSFNNKLPNEYYYKQRKSCSNIYTHCGSTEDGEYEDKMDILWEDHFNQEVSKLEANYKNKRNNSINSSAGDMGKLGCVHALKLSKNGNGAVFSAAKKPTTIVVFIKVFKKLFLLHNNSHHKNNRSLVKHNRAW